MRRIHYAWIVAAVGFVTLITAAGFRSTTGVLIVPLQNEFGWSRATIGVAVAINLCSTASVGRSADWSNDSASSVTIGALLGVSAGSSLTVLMTAPWQLDILWGVVNGLATGAISVPLAAIIANRWFVERRGLVTGILTASSATGQLIFLPLLAAIVKIFGRERVGVVFGWIFCSHMVGAALAAWGAGAIRTWFGGYGWAFGSAGLLCLFASGLVVQIARTPHLEPALVPV